MNRRGFLSAAFGAVAALLGVKAAKPITFGEVVKPRRAYAPPELTFNGINFIVRSYGKHIDKDGFIVHTFSGRVKTAHDHDASNVAHNFIPRPVDGCRRETLSIDLSFDKREFSYLDQGRSSK